MTITTLSSWKFNRRTSDAKKAANNGPVFITDHGRPAYVLLSIDDYRKLTGGQMNLVEALAQYNVQDFDFEAPRTSGLYRPDSIYPQCR